MSSTPMTSEGWNKGMQWGVTAAITVPLLPPGNYKSLPRLLIEESLHFWRKSNFHKTQITPGDCRVVKRPQVHVGLDPVPVISCENLSKLITFPEPYFFIFKMKKIMSFSQDY